MEMLREINLLSIVLRLLIAILVGGILGLERERKNRPAGFRTYMLVCVGSALVMMTNQYVFQMYDVSDPVRMGAQVISGIGFLGAGTIIVTGRNKIKGITTAAGLWTAACCGLAIGIGFYEGALIGGAAIFLIVAAMQGFDRRIRRHARYLDLYLEFEQNYLLSEFMTFAKAANIELYDIHLEHSERAVTVILTVCSRVKRPHNEVVQLISSAPGLQFIEEI